jgi:hypothetical protein
MLKLCKEVKRVVEKNMLDKVIEWLTFMVAM